MHARCCLLVSSDERERGLYVAAVVVRECECTWRCLKRCLSIGAATSEDARLICKREFDLKLTMAIMVNDGDKGAMGTRGHE